MTHSSGMIISCATGLDRLGHGEMLQNIASSFHMLCPEREIDSYAMAVVNRHQILVPDVVPVKLDRVAAFFTVENKNRLHRRLGTAGLLIFFMLRFYAITRYYIRLYKIAREKSVLLDLEFEPIQSMAADILVPWRKLPRQVSIIHSFPNDRSVGLKKYYKALSLVLIRRHVRVGNIVGLMTPADYDAAAAAGMDRRQLVLVGWGLDHRPPAREAWQKNVMGDEVRFVSAGVLRKDKRIEKVIQYFMAIDDPRISLKIAGAPVDVSASELQHIAATLQSRTSVTVEARYFASDEFAELFSKADVIVLSHHHEFQSMSGPLLAALQLRKPILCFSGHNVARIVSELSAGIVVDLDEKISESLRMELPQLRHRKYDLPEDFPYSWLSISRRLKTSISSHWPDSGFQ